jgi:hypothetical protein
MPTSDFYRFAVLVINFFKKKEATLPLMFRLTVGYAVQAACWFQNSLAGLQKRLSIFDCLFCF